MASSVALSPDGGSVFVAGASGGGSAESDYITIAYDALTGSRRWIARFDGPGHGRDAATFIEASGDGTRVFVTGFSLGSGRDFDYATVAYDSATGGRAWVRRYRGPLGSNDVPSSVGVSADGSRVFITGRSGLGSAFDYATVGYEASTGMELWVSRYNGPGDAEDEAFSLGVRPDGSEVFVTGRSFGTSDSEFDFATVAYDATTGAQQWVSRYDAGFADDAFSLGVSPDGSSVFVTGGSTPDAAETDYGTVAYDASSRDQLWVSRYNTPDNANDFALALAVSPTGLQVFVTGMATTSSSSIDYTTVAYEAGAGVQLWVEAYTGPDYATDVASSIGVSPDGSSVFVTGKSSGAGTGLDFATVAYSA